MNNFSRTTVSLALVSGFSLALLSASGKSADPAPSSTPAKVAATASPVVAAPAAEKLSTEQFKAIAEGGFIYGLPLVMNYAVMYEYAVDKGGSQFKAPFNQIKNEARVYTYKDTAVVTANSDTPYSFLWLDLRAEPMLISVRMIRRPPSSSIFPVRAIARS